MEIRYMFKLLGFRHWLRAGSIEEAQARAEREARPITDMRRELVPVLSD